MAIRDKNKVNTNAVNEGSNTAAGTGTEEAVDAAVDTKVDPTEVDTVAEETKEDAGPSAAEVAEFLADKKKKAKAKADAKAKAEAKEKADKVKADAKVKEDVPAPAEETKEVAVTQQVGGVAVFKNGAPSLVSLKDVLDPEEFGNIFKRIVAASGAAMEADGKIDLGKWIDIQLISSSYRWMVTPVADDKDKEAKKFCRPSYDGKTIPGRDGEAGESIKDYTESVEEYEEFTVKKYQDLFCLVFNCEATEQVGEAKGWGIVQVSLSPTSMRPYKAFEMQTKIFVASGVMKADKQNCFRIKAVKKSSPSNNWTIFEPANIPHVELEAYTPINPM